MLVVPLCVRGDGLYDSLLLLLFDPLHARLLYFYGTIEN